MNTILMCGSENGIETVNMLFAAIRSAHYGAIHINDDSVSIIPPKVVTPDFIVIDSKVIKNVHTQGGIALFRKHVPARQNRAYALEIPPAFFAVIDSDSSEAADMLRGDGIQTITCGLSQKDTVTFSSLENDRAVVSLQRGLKALDGSHIEPVEVPITFSPAHSEYPMLAAVAVLLLSGVAIPEAGLKLI
jgi:hypothetical protein